MRCLLAFLIESHFATSPLSILPTTITNDPSTLQYSSISDFSTVSTYSQAISLLFFKILIEHPITFTKNTRPHHVHKNHLRATNKIDGFLYPINGPDLPLILGVMLIGTHFSGLEIIFAILDDPSGHYLVSFDQSELIPILLFYSFSFRLLSFQSFS